MSAKVTERHRKLVETAIRQGICNRVNAYSRKGKVSPDQLIGAFYDQEIKCHVDVVAQLLADAIEQRALEEWEDLARPYPESIFTPLSDEELARCVDALTKSGVPAASDRLHANWARHWSRERLAALKAEVKPASDKGNYESEFPNTSHDPLG